jgi:hypothetical protein
VWSAKSGGGFAAPTKVWESASWDATRTKPVAGDFNGDGRDDIGAFYDYTGSSTAVWAWSAKSSGGFNAPTRMWDSTTWDATRTKPVSGDFNGDGRDDIGFCPVGLGALIVHAGAASARRSGRSS